MLEPKIIASSPCLVTSTTSVFSLTTAPFLTASLWNISTALDARMTPPSPLTASIQPSGTLNAPAPGHAAAPSPTTAVSDGGVEHGLVPRAQVDVRRGREHAAAVLGLRVLPQAPRQAHHRNVSCLRVGVADAARLAVRRAEVVEEAEALQHQHARAAELPMIPAPTTITSYRAGASPPSDAAIVSGYQCGGSNGASTEYGSRGRRWGRKRWTTQIESYCFKHIGWRRRL
jgi:hypothetical protein